MIMVYPDWVRRDFQFKEVALVRLTALEEWLLDKDFTVMYSSCCAAISEIESIKIKNV